MGTAEIIAHFDYHLEKCVLYATSGFILPNVTEACLLSESYPRVLVPAEKIVNVLRRHTCPIVTGVDEGRKTQ
ncbi:MAG: hypothetical protein ACLRSW_09135 [Christensenellaceae bacterium]